MKLKEEWNEEAARALKVQDRVLRLIGIWPLGAESSVSLRRWLLAMIVQISCICSLSLEMYRRCLDAEDTMDAFLFDVSSLVSLSKLFVLRVNWRYTYDLVNSVLEDWSTVEDPRNRLIMKKYFTRGRIVSLTILYLGYASGASFVFKALPLDAITSFQTVHEESMNSTRTKEQEIPDTAYFLSTYCVFGSLPGVLHGCILALQAVQIFVNATSHCGSDGFFFTLVMHLCGQFEILKMNFAELDGEESICRKKFRLLIRKHCRLVLLADSLEHAFNMIILSQLLMSMLLLCVEGFGLVVSLHTKDNTASLKHVILILTMLVQIYLYCYAGDVLEDQSEEIPRAIYSSAWYYFRPRFARNLIFVIIRGSTPHQVTAGRFLSMNLFTFKEILKASASYLSVLRVMLDT